MDAIITSIVLFYEFNGIGRETNKNALEMSTKKVLPDIENDNRLKLHLKS